MFKIWGMFAQDGELNMSKEGYKGHTDWDTTIEFTGDFSLETQGGTMTDTGLTELSVVVMSQNRLWFTKQYFYMDGMPKPTQVWYEFVRTDEFREANGQPMQIWKGTWQTSTQCNSGLAECALEEMPDNQGFLNRQTLAADPM